MMKSKKEGHWFDENDIKYPIVNSNTDVYRLDDEGNRLIIKIQKKMLSLINIYS